MSAQTLDGVSPNACPDVDRPKRRRRRHDGFEAQMLSMSEQLMREFESVPLIDIVRALNDARRTTVDWLGQVDPSALHDLARWNLSQQSLDDRV